MRYLPFVALFLASIGVSAAAPQHVYPVAPKRQALADIP